MCSAKPNVCFGRLSDSKMVGSRCEREQQLCYSPRHAKMRGLPGRQYPCADRAAQNARLEAFRSACSRRASRCRSWCARTARASYWSRACTGLRPPRRWARSRSSVTASTRGSVRRRSSRPTVARNADRKKWQSLTIRDIELRSAL